MTTSEVLNFTEKPIIDDGIERFEYHEYESVSTNLNKTGEIRINIEQQDLYVLPSEAYLLVEGRLLKFDGTPYAVGTPDAPTTGADVVTLVNNVIMHMFSEISYYLSNQQVETISNPGVATTMLGYLKYPVEFQVGEGMNQLWQRDVSTDASLTDANTGFYARWRYIVQQPAEKGTFSFCIPLKHIFGFCDHSDKIIYGFKHTIALKRQGDDDAIFRSSSVAIGKIDLTKLSLFMPHVTPSFQELNNLTKSIESKVTIPIAFSSRQYDRYVMPVSNMLSWRLSARTATERPRFIIIGFQTNRDGNQILNSSVFDHCDLKNIYVTLNSDRYPAVDYDLSFSNNKYSRVYRDAAKFDNKMYGITEIMAQPNLTALNYKSICPLFVIDVSKQSEKLKSTVLDIQVKATFNSNIPANTIAHAVVISDRMMQFQSDGNKMNVVY